MRLETLLCATLASALLAGCSGDVPSLRKSTSISETATLPAADSAALVSVSPTLHPTDTIVGPGSDGSVDRLAVLNLMRQGDFDSLEHTFESQQRRQERNPILEEDLDLSFLAFGIADPAIGPSLDEWIQLFPHSAFALLARAKHFHALGWEKRGGKWAKETTAEQFRGMTETHAQSVRDIKAALGENPRLLQAYGLLINVMTGIGDPRTCSEIAEKALRIAPASFGIRIQLLRCHLPRWGGSYAAVERIAQEAQRFVVQNPRLAALTGVADSDRGRLASSNHDFERAVQLHSKALRSADFWRFFDSRAYAEYKLERYEGSVADFDRALELLPQRPDTLIRRARALSAMGRIEAAMSDIRLVGALDPTNPRLVILRKRVVGKAVAAGHEHYTARRFGDAIESFNDAIETDSLHAEAYYWRGRSFLRLGDYTRARQDFERCVGLDPRHFEAYRNLDWILGQQGEWDIVDRYWTDFLKLEPSHAAAYLERAGTHRHRGDLDAAQADLERACELGSEKACGYASR